MGDCGRRGCVLSGGMVSGLSHVTFAVSNLARSLHFYGELLGLRTLVRWEAGAYLSAGEFWICLIVDPAAAEATNNSSYTHVAFFVVPDEFSAWREKLLAHDAEEWQPNSSPGESFYFLDPDGHKLEIHARTLADRLDSLRREPKPGIQWINAAVNERPDVALKRGGLLLVERGQVREQHLPKENFMSSQSKRNQAAESRLMDESQVEQRAVQIARDEGREEPSADDRSRAREELYAPNENTGDPEVSAEEGGDRSAFDDVAGESGTRAPRVKPEDEKSIGKELVEEGLREPNATREAD